MACCWPGALRCVGTAHWLPSRRNLLPGENLSDLLPVALVRRWGHHCLALLLSDAAQQHFHRPLHFLQRPLRVRPALILHGTRDRAHRLQSLVGVLNHAQLSVLLDLHAGQLDDRVVLAVPVQITEHRDRHRQSANDKSSR